MNAAILAIAPARIQSGRLRRGLAFAKDIAVGTILSATPVTAVIVLGWFMRRMAWVSGASGARPNWALGPGRSVVTRSVSGLWANTRAGLAALFTLLLSALPFTALWSLAWWAGWENSFNKGYEQAAAGPLLSLLAIAMALPMLAITPMALAHQAASGQWRSFFAWRQIRRLIARTGWRYAALIVATTLLALPVAGFRILPVFVEEFAPQLAGMTAEEAAGVQDTIRLGFAAYVFIALLVLRGGAARLHRLATSRLAHEPPHWLKRAACWSVMLAATFMFAAQIYFSQFMNHGWMKWLQHPFILLPWAY